jgi:hypothetical protein
MSNYRYLEFDSTFRNRNEWIKPGEFEVQISLSGRKNQLSALDPVCDSRPILAWSSNQFSAAGSFTVPFSFVSPIAGGSDVSSSGDTVSLVIYGANLQEKDNYYNHAVFYADTGGGTVCMRRVVSYTYLKTSGGSVYGEVILSSALPDVFMDGVTVMTGSFTDPTDFSDVNHPLIFVPTGYNIPNAYAGELLYNETRNQYRPILNYDNVTGILTLDTSGSSSTPNMSGPIPGSWTEQDNFSIRASSPFLPLLGSAVYPTVIATTTIDGVLYTTSARVVCLSNVILSSEFKNYGFRIIPGGSAGGIGLKYNFVDNEYSIAPSDESAVIYKYAYDSVTQEMAIYSFSPLLTVAPPVDTYVELLRFTTDNANPFVYTGSLESQQQYVCYEIKLLNLILPNLVLKSGKGGRIAFYPYVYVILSNTPKMGNSINTIYSNNPNSTEVLFRAPVYDISSPLVSSYVNLDGDGMVQTIKFRPNESLFFSVVLPDGQIFETVLQDTVNPAPPNPYVQISAAFGIQRVTNNPISSMKK